MSICEKEQVEKLQRLIVHFHKFPSRPPPAHTHTLLRVAVAVPHLDVVLLLPHLLPVDLEEGVPVRGDGSLLRGPQHDAPRDVVEAPLLLRGLPPQVDAPPHVVGAVRQAASSRASGGSWLISLRVRGWTLATVPNR